MTEKQYKGIAGNFLICDVQKEYAEHLLSILVKRFGMRFQFHFFSNVKKIEQFAEKAEIEILLIAEDCVSEIRGNVKAKKNIKCFHSFVIYWLNNWFVFLVRAAWLLCSHYFVKENFIILK